MNSEEFDFTFATYLTLLYYPDFKVLVVINEPTSYLRTLCLAHGAHKVPMSASFSR